MEIAENWLILALASPVIWAAICLIDSFFIGKGVFRSAFDGPVIAGVFCVIPLVFLILSESNSLVVSYRSDSHLMILSKYVQGNTLNALLCSVLAALFYSAHIYFYFRTLFRLNDCANTESVLSLSVALVPILAWFLLGERMSSLFYAAVGLTAFGLIVSCWSTLRRICNDSSEQVESDVAVGTTIKSSCSVGGFYQLRDPGTKIIGLGPVASLLVAVFCFSAYMVLQAKAFKELNFVEVSISFNATMSVLAAIVLLSSTRYRQRICNLLIRCFPIFLLAEGLELLARLAAQRAIEISPSVTAVALVQCLLPPLIIFTSWTLMGSDRIWKYLTPATRQTLAMQCEDLASKFTLLVVTLIAMVVLQHDGSLF